MRSLLRSFLMLLLVLAPLAVAGCSSRLSEEAADEQSSAEEYAESEPSDESGD